MAIYEVYSKSVRIKYKSSLCSKGTIFSAFATIFSVTFPFLIAYRSHGFWLRMSSYREQPLINFKHQYLLYMETDESDFPILCSTFPISEEFENHCTLIKSREEDSNRDGYHDKLIINIEVEQFPSNLSPHFVQLILIFDYTLQKHCMLNMEGAGFIEFNSAFPVRKLEMSGDLKLVQKRLFRSDITHTHYNKSVFNFNPGDGTSLFNLHQAINHYSTREVRTEIVNRFHSWKRGRLGPKEAFKLSVNILYPEETIHYIPTFWQIMKWAWMQYLSLVIIFVYLSGIIKNYVFSNHLVSTYKDVPWNVKGS